MAAIQHICEINQLKPADWNSHDPFDRLVEELKTQGPLLVWGFFGSVTFKEDPVLLPSLSLGDIMPYGWKVSQERNKDWDKSANSHAVLLCGAQRLSNGSEFVYYKDPAEASVPLHLRKPGEVHRDLLVMRYHNFIKHLVDLNGDYPAEKQVSCAYYSEHLLKEEIK